jgi:hypothetical protein
MTTVGQKYRLRALRCGACSPKFVLESTLLLLCALTISGCSLPKYDLTVQNKCHFPVTVDYLYVDYHFTAVDAVLGTVQGDSTATFKRVLFPRAAAHHLQIKDPQRRLLIDSITPAATVKSQLVDDNWTFTVDTRK